MIFTFVKACDVYQNGRQVKRVVSRKTSKNQAEKTAEKPVKKKKLVNINTSDKILKIEI